MFVLCKANITVFVLQAVAGVVAYGIGGDTVFAIVAAAVVAIVVVLCVLAFTYGDALGAFKEALIYSSIDAFMASAFVLFVAMLVAEFDVASDATLFAATLVATLALFTSGFVLNTARNQQRQSAEESIVLLFFTAMPLGIGTILGGAIFLARKLAVKPQAA